MKKIISSLISGIVLSSMISVLPASAGEFRTADVIKLYQHLHGKQILSQEEFQNYDQNQDGAVNIFDLIAVKRAIIRNRVIQEIYPEDFPTDEITAVRPAVWEKAISQSRMLIESAEELETTLNLYFRPGVVRTYLKIYTPDFFEKQNLLLVFWFGYTHKGTPVSLSRIPAEKDQDISAFRILTEKELIPCEFFCADRDDVFSVSHGENYLIDTYEKYQNFDLESLPEPFRNYPESFFESKAIYLHSYANYYPSGSERYFYSAEKAGEYLVITAIQKSVKNDLYSPFCDIIILNQADIQNTEIMINTINLKDDQAGTTFYYPFPEQYGYGCYLAVNYDSFYDESQLTFWKTSSPSGMIPHSQWEELASENYEYQNPFSEQYEISETPAGILYSGDRFTLIWSENSVTVCYPDDSGRILQKIFEY